MLDTSFFWYQTQETSLLLFDLHDSISRSKSMFNKVLCSIFTVGMSPLLTIFFFFFLLIQVFGSSRFSSSYACGIDRILGLFCIKSLSFVLLLIITKVLEDLSDMVHYIKKLILSNLRSRESVRNADFIGQKTHVKFFKKYFIFSVLHKKIIIFCTWRNIGV